MLAVCPEASLVHIVPRLVPGRVGACLGLARRHTRKICPKGSRRLSADCPSRWRTYSLTRLLPSTLGWAPAHRVQIFGPLLLLLLLGGAKTKFGESSAKGCREGSKTRRQALATPGRRSLPPLHDGVTHSHGGMRAAAGRCVCAWGWRDGPHGAAVWQDDAGRHTCLPAIRQH